jgi:hypothetical protein
MSTRPAIKVLHTEIGRGGQDVFYTEVLRIGPHICQICIKSDSYDFQSFAVASVWSREALCWNEAASIHYSQMRTETKLAYEDANRLNASHFRADRTTLIEQLIVLLADDAQRPA